MKKLFNIMFNVVLKLFFVFLFLPAPNYSQGFEENTYKVENIKIFLSNQDENLYRELANEEAISIAFQKILSWLISNKEYSELVSSKINLKEFNLKNFVIGYQIKNENFSNGSYSAEFSVMFDKRLITEWLIKNNIYISVRKVPKILVVPILMIGDRNVLWDDPNLWRLLWQNISSENTFIPLIFPHGDAEDLIALSYNDAKHFNLVKINNFANRYDLPNILIPSLEISVSDNDHYQGLMSASIISENKVKNFFVERQIKSFPGEIIDDFMIRAINIISDEFSDYWYQVNQQSAKEINFNVYYNTFDEWKFIRDTIENLNEINKMIIISIGVNSAKVNAYISFTKEEDLFKLFQSFRIDIKRKSETNNEYDINIEGEYNVKNEFEVLNKNKIEEEINILVIE